MNYIKLTLKAQFMSFGDDTSIYQNRRDTATHPTKSMIIGLIACAIGIPRGDERVQSLFDSVSVKTTTINKSGQIWNDYQNAHMSNLTNNGKYEFVRAANGSVQNIQRWKTYILSGEYIVFVGSDNETDLKTIHDFLFAPYWPLYAGRKCCPFTEKIVEKDMVLYNEEELLREVDAYNEKKGDSVSLCICQ